MEVFVSSQLDTKVRQLRFTVGSGSYAFLGLVARSVPGDSSLRASTPHVDGLESAQAVLHPFENKDPWQYTAAKLVLEIVSSGHCFA